jgi:predicted amidohydrolase
MEEGDALEGELRLDGSPFSCCLADAHMVILCWGNRYSNIIWRSWMGKSDHEGKKGRRMKARSLRIGLASLRHPETIPEGVDKVVEALKQGVGEGADVVCFPETYIPGLRGLDVDVPPPDQEAQAAALRSIRLAARQYGIAVIVGMEWCTEIGLQNRAYVISSAGRVLGYQTKNQITPEGESDYYVPDGQRRIFTIKGVKFGIVICHEGWRYPETVRWAVVRGAQIVFQPQMTGSDKKGRTLKCWGESFYEQAMICRAQENTIYFASVNTAMRFQNSATSLIGPSGKWGAECMAYVPYGKEELLIADVDLSKATRFFAKRYHPEWYPE